MIDAAEQGRGYGSAALREALAYIRTKPFCSSDRVVLTCHRDHSIAVQMYRNAGFRLTGNRDEDELALVLN